MFENPIVPLKSDMPCIDYDFSVFCDCMLGIIPCELPQYLSSYSERLKYYASLKDRLRPVSFPDAYRVYIIDYRLNVLFAALDASGKMATYFSKYGKYAHDLEYYYYGDGEKFGDVLIPSFAYDKNSMKRFLQSFGFLPIEELSMASALIFDGDELSDRRLLSQYQTQVLMEKYRNRNLVDWKNIIQQETASHPF
ncbi:MAG: hypothetical protein NC305_13450 [Lachnospiraceae bacterium]|nr:hypothetical protein [Butyrivibrio sp.]MCM1343996.1 hypothetical protein [Muribaculaceae bacterium]MCM1411537.1 hypothetical protein [Lachnospiraceae bacterium]